MRLRNASGAIAGSVLFLGLAAAVSACTGPRQPPAFPDQAQSFVGSGPQCTGVEPPPAAKAAGLTRLQFCDDFSDAGSFDFEGTGNPGFKWYRNYWFKFSRATSPHDGEPENSFTMRDGVLELRPTKAHYQSNMQSAILKNDRPVGYYINRETGGWYVEARVAHPASADGVGVWSMDMCHVYHFPSRCVRFVEPDWYEYWEGAEARATHMWISRRNQIFKEEPDCNNVWKNDFDTNAFRTYGARTTAAGVTYWRDDAQVAACDTMPWRGAVVAGPPEGGYNVGRYPIYVGSKPGHSLKLDFVRVWVRP